MNKILVICLLICTNLFGQSKNDAFNQFLKLDQTKSATIAFEVENLSTSATEVRYNESKLLYPASLQKLVTTSTALNILGKDFQFKTEMILKGEKNESTFKGIIEIKASGDPSLDESFVDKVYDFLKEKGIDKIEGYIIVNESKFDNTPNQSWLIEDIANYYGSPAFGFNFMENTYKLKFQQSAEGTQPKYLSTSPYMRNLIFDNQVISKGKKDLAYILGVPFSNERMIVGSIPSGTGTFTIKGAMENPAQIFKNMLIKKFKAENFGFVFNASIASEKVLFSKENNSETLDLLLKETNQKSNNLYAEALLKAIGLKQYGFASTENGIKAIEEYFKSDETFIYDGSGLSRKNKTSSSFLMKVLSQNKDNNVLKNSLGVSGVSGTLKYLNSEKIKGKIQAKSGSADGILNYAGYFKNAQGEQMAFVFMINNYTGSRTSLRKEMVKVLEAYL